MKSIVENAPLPLWSPPATARTRRDACVFPPRVTQEGSSRATAPQADPLSARPPRIRHLSGTLATSLAPGSGSCLRPAGSCHAQRLDRCRARLTRDSMGRNIEQVGRRSRGRCQPRHGPPRATANQPYMLIGSRRLSAGPVERGDRCPTDGDLETGDSAVSREWRCGRVAGKDVVNVTFRAAVAAGRKINSTSSQVTGVERTSRPVSRILSRYGVAAVPVATIHLGPPLPVTSVRSTRRLGRAALERLRWRLPLAGSSPS